MAMNRDRKILLLILFFSVIASLTSINLIVLKDRRDRALSGLDLMERQFVRLQEKSRGISPESIDELKTLIELEKGRFFSKEETDPYRLGLEILAMLEKRGIKVAQYKTLQQEEGFLLEFSVSARASSFFPFWEDMNRQGRYYDVPYFSIKTEKSGVSSTFRIGYAVYE